MPTNYKKLLIVIIFSVIVGSFLGSVFSATEVSANVLDNIFEFLKKGAALEKKSDESSPPIKESSPKELYKPAKDYEQAVVDAVQSAQPSVVSIVISKDLPVLEECIYDPFSGLSPDFRGFFGQGFQFSQPCSKEGKTQKRETGGGSGFVVSEDGLILTNKHVVFDTDSEYTVLTSDGKKYNAKVLARDPVQDLALIKIDTTGLRPVRLGDSDTIKLGQTAIAIGNSLSEFRNTVSVGVISGLSRVITASGAGFGSEKIQGVIQTDAAINPGNSGGPLFNLRGEVIGINTAIVSGAQNVGFAIPINQAKRAIESVKRTGSIKVPYLGVRYLDIDAEMAKKQGLAVDYGALIRGTEEGPAILPNSPAAKAGVQAEDIVLEVNGEKIGKDHALSALIQKYNIGDAVALKIWRDNNIISLKVVLEERPNL